MNFRKNIFRKNQFITNSNPSTANWPATPLPRRAFTRRSFIRQTAGVAAGLGLAGAMPSAFAKPDKIKLPKPKNSGIEHIVVVMMENRSFDHFLGWLPGPMASRRG